MSIISVQFGQCGNQVGHDLQSLIWKDVGSVQARNTLNEDYTEKCVDRWFTRKSSQDQQLFSRAVMVDTESKVVENIYSQQFTSVDSWKYKKRNVLAQPGGGAGNNWANGYMKKGVELEESIMDAVRLEFEQSDCVTSILSILSSAGGTGSGVGTYITERLRDEFSTKIILSAVVLPYESGEVVTQNYNSLLTLAKLYDASDMMTVFENDRLHKMSSKLLKIREVSVSDLNYLISSKLGSVLQPTHEPTHHISSIVNHLASHPAYKLITLKTSPYNTKPSINSEFFHPWPTLVKHIKQTLRISTYGHATDIDWEMKQPADAHRYNSLMQYTCCISNAVFTRGKSNMELKSSIQDLNEARLYPKWLPQDVRVLHAHQNRQFLATNNFITLATNNHLIYYPLDKIIKKAWDTYNYKAYLHQYDSHGIKEDDFLEAFSKTERVVKSYHELCKK